MKVILLAHSDSIGGAARASYRLHQALLKSDIQSELWVGVKKTDTKSVLNVGGQFGKFKSRLNNMVLRLQKTGEKTPRSISFLKSNLVDRVNKSSADVVNIHWVNNEFLSIEDISRINKPIVLTLHDMWAFCGAEHYAGDGANARWRLGYILQNRPVNHSGLDIDRWVWHRKLKAWQNPIHIITPSNWLASCVKDSALMRNWPVTVIPNVLDISQFMPYPKLHAQKSVGLPKDKRIIMFGAVGGGADLRKGWDLLQQALPIVAAKLSNVECIIFGQSTPMSQPKLGLPLHWIGNVDDDARLAMLYSVADVMVVPSRQENLPQTATEAQACGCPVVAFDCTGMPDVVEHKQTGYLAKPYDVMDLAEGILWVLADKARHGKLSAASRRRAISLWSAEKVVAKYLNDYETAMNHYASEAGKLVS